MPSILKHASRLWAARLVAPALLACLAACATATDDERAEPDPSEPAIRVHGALAFRDGVTPPAGSVAIVTLRDFVDQAAPPVATRSIELQSARAMLDFELSAPLSRLAGDRQYVVTAVVTGPRDEALWTTDVAQLIDTAQAETNVGVLLMTQARTPGTSDPAVD